MPARYRPGRNRSWERHHLLSSVVIVALASGSVATAWAQNGTGGTAPDAGTHAPTPPAGDSPPLPRAEPDSPSPAASEPSSPTDAASQQPEPAPGPSGPPGATALPTAGADLLALTPPDSIWPGLLPQVHAFVSQGFVKSTENNFLVNSKRGSFEFTEVGINFTQVLTDRLRTGIQLFARQLGKAGDFNSRMDWFYLDYRFADWLGLRAGRTKVPFGLYNEFNDIDAGRVPILLPQSVYPVLNRDILLAQTGAELYGYVELGVGGALEYRLYGGTLFVSPPVAPPGATLADFQVPYLLGGRLMWDAPLEGLRLGGSSQVLRFNTTYNLPAPMGMPPVVLEWDLPFLLWLASAEYVHRNLSLAAEYGRWRADLELTGAPTYRVVNERYYAMAAYRFAPWFTTSIYYASLVTDIHKPHTPDNYRRDVAATLRFDVNSYWLFKVEGHFMNGTDELDPALNGGLPPTMLAKNWLVFLLKTTLYY